MKIGLIKVLFFIYVIIGLSSFRNIDVVNDSNLNSSHPCLILTKESVPELQKGINSLPLFKKSYNEVITAANKALEEGIIVPIPIDPGGGYTHEQHKRNYVAMYNAGISYQLSGDEKYALFVKNMLLEYAAMYPSLSVHPQMKNQSPGKLFWQGLNESVWLVYTIQAYDCIYDYVQPVDRENIENNLFRKVVEFFTVEDSYSFNRVHNHGTWASAGVGMTGIVLNDSNYVEMALYGTDKSGNAGFFKQIDELFSPDGYFAEGPYYQRYAIMPFVLFAQALENNRKDLKIFEFKEGVLNKAVLTLLQLTNSDGKFYPLNDAIKDKNFLSPELVYAVDIAYNNTNNAELLSVVQKHGRVMLSAEGLKAARDVNNGLSKELVRKPAIISDGSKGNQGGIAILRTNSDEKQLSVILKATSQGMGHGHYDRLSFIMYENGNEIIQDYGAARFLNIVQKDGGRYLLENSTWANQTIAHNTLVINGQSNFDGNLDSASKYHPDILYSELDSNDIQIVAVSDSHCYKPAVIQRTMALIKYNNHSILVDLFRVMGSNNATCDLPIYYQGQIMSTNFEYNAAVKQINVLGTKNGYQHLWKLAEAKNLNGTQSVTWLFDKRFYTYSFAANANTELFFTKIGATDPNFNLRDESGILIRQKKVDNYSFLSTIEAHGFADPIKEAVEGTISNIKVLSIIYQDKNVSCVKIEFLDGAVARLFISHIPNNDLIHTVELEGKTISWKGNYSYSIVQN
jgi:oligo-alginate lyase